MEAPRSPWWKDALIAVGILALVLGFLFRESFESEKVVFANDAPLGAIQAHAQDERTGWSFWQDLNWVGGEYPSAMPNFTKLFFETCLVVGGDNGAILFAKWYQPMALVLLGLAGWIFFRALKFPQPICVLGGLALALNGDLFSYTAWGLPSVVLGAAGALLAMAAVLHAMRETGWRLVAWGALGGVGLGQGVMESFDVGGIFSLYVAAFVMMAAFNRSTVKSQPAQMGLKGAGVLALVVAASTLMAWHTVDNLFRTEGKALKDRSDPSARIKQVEDQFIAQVAQIQAAQDLPPEQRAGFIAQITEQKDRIVDLIRRQPYDAATQWSLPPMESLRMAVPGLYGYRDPIHGWLDYPLNEEQRYWGRVGQTPSFTRVQSEKDKFSEAMAQYMQTNPGAQGLILRHGSSGVYMGLLVLVAGLWAVLQAARGAAGIFEKDERHWIFFWAALAFISLVLAWGHYTPLYKLVYNLPFFNSIRNPIKFMHPCSVAMVVLFAYGLHGIFQVSRQKPARGPDVVEQFKSWVAALQGWDKRWAIGMGAAMLFAVLIWVGYAATQPDLERHLNLSLGFDKESAQAIANGSLFSAAVALLFLAGTLGLLALWLSGVFAKRREGAGWILLGLLLVVDLSIGSAPHLVHYDFQKKYATTDVHRNDVVDRLKKLRPHEQRVARSPMLGNEMGKLGQEIQMREQMILQATNQVSETVINLREQWKELKMLELQLQTWNRAYYIDWLQALFQFHGIHATDIIQDPRPDPANQSFRQAVGASVDPFRLQQLTSTRYWLGHSFEYGHDMDFHAQTTNQFTVKERFFFMPHPDDNQSYVARSLTNGLLAVVEYEGALPRAGVYANWRGGVGDEEALATLAAVHWDPRREVLIAENIPAPEQLDFNATVVPARYLEYDPKRVKLETDADTATVLLLNDKHHPGWKVTVDGEPAQLLRANYLMRGVHLPPGKHVVEFRFAPPEGSVYVSLSGLGLGLIAFVGLLRLPRRPEEEEEEIVVEVPPEEPGEDADEAPKGPSDDPETPTAPETSSKDERPKPSPRKSRSRSGRRKKR